MKFLVVLGTDMPKVGELCIGLRSLNNVTAASVEDAVVMTKVRHGDIVHWCDGRQWHDTPWGLISLDDGEGWLRRVA